MPLSRFKSAIPSFFSPKSVPRDVPLAELPLEIIEHIIFQTVDVQTLFRLLTICRATLSATEASLYHTIDLRTIYNGHMERRTYKKWSGLIRKLSNSPRHAAMVFYVLGTMRNYTVQVDMKTMHQGRVFTPGTISTSMALYFQMLPAKLPRLRALEVTSIDGPQINSAIQCLSNDLRELQLCSSTIYNAMHPNKPPEIAFLTTEKLEAFISRQQKLRHLKAIPQDFVPRLPGLSQRVHPLWTFSQQLNAIEGSFWFLNDVLPLSVLPQKLRFWDSMDPYTETAIVPPTFWQRLQQVRVLSWTEGNRKSTLDIAELLSHLPLLHTLELVLSPLLLMSADRALSLTSKCAQSLQFNGVELKYFVVTMPTTESKHTIDSLFEDLSDLAFKDIQTLESIEAGIQGQEYARATRENRVARSIGIKSENWWVDQ
ncbi:hypothetical protein DL96DRAFT_1820274 [Flagelloscypha sp. PMI_526]|nr:hypothetical protein DL96DRAFT_1820274 [Flagelloscypha sp. PMI_526]